MDDRPIFVNRPDDHDPPFILREGPDLVDVDEGMICSRGARGPREQMPEQTDGELGGVPLYIGSSVHFDNPPVHHIPHPHSPFPVEGLSVGAFKKAGDQEHWKRVPSDQEIFEWVEDITGRNFAIPTNANRVVVRADNVTGSKQIPQYKNEGIWDTSDILWEQSRIRNIDYYEKPQMRFLWGQHNTAFASSSMWLHGPPACREDIEALWEAMSFDL